MQHPLQNPSLAPFGFAFPHYKERLDHKSEFDPNWVNPERAMAKFWQKIHRQDIAESLPMEEIIHTILPAMGTRWRLQNGDFSFRDRLYLGRDIALISTAVYWFATNVGNCFLRYPHGLHTPKRHDHEFLEKFTRYMKEQRNLVAMWAHVCNNECTRKTMIHTGIGRKKSARATTLWLKP
jgi:hypothetical protein